MRLELTEVGVECEGGAFDIKNKQIVVGAMHFILLVTLESRNHSILQMKSEKWQMISLQVLLDEMRED